MLINKRKKTWIAERSNISTSRIAQRPGIEWNRRGNIIVSWARISRMRRPPDRIPRHNHPFCRIFLKFITNLEISPWKRGKKQAQSQIVWTKRTITIIIMITLFSGLHASKNTRQLTNALGSPTYPVKCIAHEERQLFSESRSNTSAATTHLRTSS